MSKFIDKAIELQPFMTCNSGGHSNPKDRKAFVELAFYGADALDKAQALHDAIVADVRSAESSPSK